MKLFGSRICFIIATMVWGLFALFPVWLLFCGCIIESHFGFRALLYGPNEKMVYPNTDLCDSLHLSLFCIIMVEAFAIMGRNLFVKSDSRRVWRLTLNAIFIALLAPAVGASLSFAWNLLHYIRVMGMTPVRRTGELFALFAFAVPIFSIARWLINTRAANKVIRLAALSLVAASLALVGINLSVIHHCSQTCQEQGNTDCLATQGPSDGTAVQTKTMEPFAYERRAALWTDAWGGMRVDWTAVADWPTGDSPAAKAARRWIDQQLRYGGKSFYGDLRDWEAMTRFHGRQFLAENGPKQIEAEWRGPNGEETEPRTGKPDVDPGADAFLEESPSWFSRHSATIEYEDEHIVSYRSGFYGFHVGNATSAAHVGCATFRKSDGKILGWDTFADTNKVFQLIREQAKEKFGEKADIYGRGIPMPDKPLFTKDGFRVFWGDYSIDAPHAYEDNGKFPSLLIYWHSADGCLDPITRLTGPW